MQLGYPPKLLWLKKSMRAERNVIWRPGDASASVSKPQGSLLRDRGEDLVAREEHGIPVESALRDVSVRDRGVDSLPGEQAAEVADANPVL